jgi:hypothetical protein
LSEYNLLRGPLTGREGACLSKSESNTIWHGLNQNVR